MWTNKHNNSITPSLHPQSSSSDGWRPLRQTRYHNTWCNRTCSMSLLFLYRRYVGTLYTITHKTSETVMCSSIVRFGLLSTSIFTKFTLSYALLSAANWGAIILQGPHHVAEKFMMQGFDPYSVNRKENDQHSSECDTCRRPWCTWSSQQLYSKIRKEDSLAKDLRSTQLLTPTVYYRQVHSPQTLDGAKTRIIWGASFYGEKTEEEQLSTR